MKIAIKPTYLAIANGTHAFIYDLEHHNRKTEHAETFTPVMELTHPDSRLKISELVEDRAGKPGTNGVHGKYESHDDPHEIELKHFAKEIAAVLERAREQNKYERLIIAAAPRFHGILKQHLSKNVEALVSEHIQKDYAALHTKELNVAIKKIVDELV